MTADIHWNGDVLKISFDMVLHVESGTDPEIVKSMARDQIFAGSLPVKNVEASVISSLDTQPPGPESQEVRLLCKFELDGDPANASALLRAIASSIN